MRCTISLIYFDKELYMFRTDLMSIIMTLNTVYTAIGICHASYVDCLLARSGPSSTTIIRELALNLAKVIFMVKHSVKLRRYLLCGCVAACCFDINM